MACINPPSTDQVTRPKFPAGPAFTLGSIAVDGAVYGQPTTAVLFAEAKQEALRAVVNIRSARTLDEIDELLASAKRALQSASRVTRDKAEKQSLGDRIRTLETSAQTRKQKLFEAERRESAEYDFSTVGLADMWLLDESLIGSSSTYCVILADDNFGYFKPDDGYQQFDRDGIAAGSEWRREVAAYRVDQILGLGLVPTTVPRDEEQIGLRGSLQESVPHEALLTREQYSDRDRAAMAVLDYVLGNTDRHSQNYRTRVDGSLAAIDHGFTLPQGTNDPIRSSFVTDALLNKLPHEMILELRTVEPATVRDTLLQIGIEPVAADAATERLREIQRDGRISGRAWGGRIVDADWKS